MALAIGLITALGAGSAFAAESTIKVTLWDKGPDSIMMDDAHPMGYGTPNLDMSMAMVGVTADIASVPAGAVTFDVTNTSKDIVHEMILSPATADGTPLPYIADENRVDEDASGHLGEVAELDPGQGGSLTVDMTPGTYVLYCNIPGHFIGGMWTLITVTP